MTYHGPLAELVPPASVQHPSTAACCHPSLLVLIIAALLVGVAFGDVPCELHSLTETQGVADRRGDVTGDDRRVRGELVALDLITNRAATLHPPATARRPVPRRPYCPRSRSEHGWRADPKGSACTRGRPPSTPALHRGLRLSRSSAVSCAAAACTFLRLTAGCADRSTSTEKFDVPGLGPVLVDLCAHDIVLLNERMMLLGTVTRLRWACVRAASGLAS